MLEQIAMQKKRELEKKNVKKEHGELLMDIRAALQNMVAMLVCVKRGNKVPTKKPTEELDKKIDIPMMEKMETDSKIKRGGGGRGFQLHSIINFLKCLHISLVTFLL